MTASGGASKDVRPFVRRWLAVEQRMQQTGRNGPYLALSTGCQDCQFLATSVAGYYAHGGYIHWAGWRVDSIKATPSADSTLVTVHAHSAPLEVKVSSSEPVHRLGVRRSTLYLRVERASGSYVVTSRSQT